MTVERGRIGDTPPPASGETFLPLASLGATQVEEIVSSSSPDTGAQVQDHDEWVVLLDGSATLEVDGVALELRAGDWVLLRARTPHRVLRAQRGTRWLAVHGGERPGG
jgi:cupin 2 domain-containing protein